MRSQMYLYLWEQVASFHIPERFGFPATGSASMKRHLPSPYQCSSVSQEIQGRKEMKSPLAGPLPSPCLSTPVMWVKNWIDLCVCNTLRGNVICSVPKALSGPLVKKVLHLVKKHLKCSLPPMCWHGVSGKNSLSGNQSVIWGLYYFLNL